MSLHLLHCSSEHISRKFAAFVHRLVSGVLLVLNCVVRYPQELASGMLEIIAPSPSYYPDFSKLKETFGDDLQRVK
jgi:hypothetical protein